MTFREYVEQFSHTARDNRVVLLEDGSIHQIPVGAWIVISERLAQRLEQEGVGVRRAGDGALLVYVDDHPGVLGTIADFYDPSDLDN